MASNILINSLKRLYTDGQLTKEQVAERVAKGSIAQGDYEKITGEAYREGEDDE